MRFACSDFSRWWKICRLLCHSSSFKKISPCLIFLNTKHLLSINCVSNLLCLNSPTLHTKKLLYFCFRWTKQGWRLARTTVQKDGDFLITGHVVFNSRVPNRKRIIRTRLKRHNFGIFRLVIFARRQPCCIFRTKICSKFYPFQVTEFWENGFLVAQGKNGGNPCRIAEYFNTAETEIRLSKSEFGLLPFG